MTIGHLLIVLSLLLSLILFHSLYHWVISSVWGSKKSPASTTTGSIGLLRSLTRSTVNLSEKCECKSAVATILTSLSIIFNLLDFSFMSHFPFSLFNLKLISDTLSPCQPGCVTITSSPDLFLYLCSSIFSWVWPATIASIPSTVVANSFILFPGFLSVLGSSPECTTATIMSGLSFSITFIHFFASSTKSFAYNFPL